MTIDLSARAKPFSIYLPSIQPNSAARIVGADDALRSEKLPKSLTAADFNYLNADNQYWHYKWCLASAGHFKDERKTNAITNRDSRSFVLGDSGGYQIGQGSLGDTKHWLKQSKKPAQIMKLWRQSDIRDDILKWLELHCDYGMTLDMPIWAMGLKKSPFHALSAQQLTELTEENLRFISDKRGRYGDCKFLNVLQGSTELEEEAWFQAVRKYPFEGWSLAGKVGQDGGIYRVIRRVLLLRDEKLLEPPYNWLHILRLSRVRWAPVMTAIQRGVQSSTGNDAFTISYDSSSPYRTGGVANKYASIGELDAAFKNWKISTDKFPTGYGYANMRKKLRLDRAHDGHLPKALSSPIATKLTVNDLNIKTDRLAVRTIDAFADEVIINHNVFIYCLASIRANEAVYSENPTAPPLMLAACDFIKSIFQSEKPMSQLNSFRRDIELAVGEVPSSKF